MIKDGYRPPEVRIPRVSYDAKVLLNFSNAMMFPSNFTAILNDRNYTDPEKVRYLEMEMLTEEIETDRGSLISWNVTSVEPTLIKVDLKFDKPLYISQGKKPDILLTTLKFDSITDIHGEGFPETLLKMKNIPPQILSEIEAIKIKTAGSLA